MNQVSGIHLNRTVKVNFWRDVEKRNSEPPKTSEHFLSSNINILRDNYVVGGRINRGRGSGLPPKNPMH